MRGLTLSDLIEGAAVTQTGEEGRWVTINGNPVFIGGVRDDELDRLKTPAQAPEGHRRVKLLFNDDGSPVMERGKQKSTALYSEPWLQDALDYKHARVRRLMREQDKINQSLVDEIEENGVTSHAGAVAACLLLISKTGMRPGGSSEGAVDKKTGKKEPTYGATTLQRRHVQFNDDGSVTFRYRGKKGVDRTVTTSDANVVEAVRGLMGGKKKAPGDKTPLFQPDIPPGSRRKTPQKVLPQHLGARIQRHNSHYKTKDLRTCLAARVGGAAVQKMLSGPKPKVPKDEKDRIKKARGLLAQLGETVSKALGNTPSVALTGYTNPALCEHLLEKSGFSPDMFPSVRSSYRLVGFVPESVESAIGKIMSSGGSLPILRALLGDDAVDSWRGQYADDSLPEESEHRGMQAVPAVESADPIRGYERLLEMAGVNL